MLLQGKRLAAVAGQCRPAGRHGGYACFGAFQGR
jgi:hypothetical protein